MSMLLIMTMCAAEKVVKPTSVSEPRDLYTCVRMRVSMGIPDWPQLPV